jgi:tetraacyldisaccharide 4'-kinase
MARWLEGIWYRGGRVPLLLRLFSWLFALAAAKRRLLYRIGLFPSHSPGAPVLVIGNITVGGTGKTPLTLWLADALTRRGFRIGIVLRGYGRSGSGIERVRADSEAARVGDEALLIAQRSGLPVAVGADRVAASRVLVAEGVNLILADDGLQHLRLKRAAEIAVIDAQRGFGNALLLPAGPLRERPARLRSVSAVVLNGDGLAEWPGALRMHLRGAELCAVDGSGRREALGLWSGRRVHALAGIGHPERFFATLAQAGLKVEAHAFPDHHRYQAADLKFSESLPVLMTEKDAVKCRTLAGSDCWYLPVVAEFAEDAAAELLRRIFMEARLLDILACPLCKGPLSYERAQSVLVCHADRLAFPIRDGAPIMLEEEARQLEPGDPLLER